MSSRTNYGWLFWVSATNDVLLQCSPDYLLSVCVSFGAFLPFRMNRSSWSQWIFSSRVGHLSFEMMHFRFGQLCTFKHVCNVYVCNAWPLKVWALPGNVDIYHIVHTLELFEYMISTPYPLNKHETIHFSLVSLSLCALELVEHCGKAGASSKNRTYKSHKGRLTSLSLVIRGSSTFPTRMLNKRIEAERFFPFKLPRCKRYRKSVIHYIFILDECNIRNTYFLVVLPLITWTMALVPSAFVGIQE